VKTSTESVSVLRKLDNNQPLYGLSFHQGQLTFRVWELTEAGCHGYKTHYIMLKI